MRLLAEIVAAVLADDSFCYGEAEAGASRVQARAHERVEDFQAIHRGNAAAIVLDCDGEAARAGARADVDFSGAGFDGVQRVAQQVDENLHQAIGIADDGFLGCDVIGELDGGGFVVDRDQAPGFFDERADHQWSHVLVTDAGEIYQALADFLKALRDPLHAREAIEGRLIFGGLDQFFDRAVQDSERRIQFVGHARRKEA